MLKRFTTRLDTGELRALKQIGQSHGGLSISKVIRVAVVGYIASESERLKAAREPVYGQGIGKALWMGSDKDSA